MLVELERQAGERSAGEIGGDWSSSIMYWSWSDMDPDEECDEEEVDEVELEVELEDSEASSGSLGRPKRLA